MNSKFNESLFTPSNISVSSKQVLAIFDDGQGVWFKVAPGWHSSHREVFPRAGARKCERLPRKLPMFDKIVELMDRPVK